MTNIQLKQIGDIEILDIIERQKRGGLCFVGSKRCVETNNKCIVNSDVSKHLFNVLGCKESIWTCYEPTVSM